MRFPSKLISDRICHNIFMDIFNSITKYQNIQENGNITKIKGIVILLKKIVQESNFDGGIIKDKKMIEKILKLIQPKDNSIKKDKDNKKANTNTTYKINLKYESSNKSDQKEKKEDICQIYPLESFYHLRYYISFIFQLPLKCIQIKKVEQNQNQLVKIYNINDDMDNIYDFINSTQKKKKEENNTFIVETIKNPFCDDTNENLRKFILNNTQLTSFLKKLLNEKNIDFTNDIYELIKDKLEKDDAIGEKGKNNK